MTRIAYKDEYPWHRCSCGWLLSQTGLMATACPGCGKIEASSHRDRFNPTNVAHDNTVYVGVPWEDKNRRA